MLITIIGKGGSGKNCLVDAMVRDGYAKFLCTDTTRPMRPGEVNGQTYNFYTEEKFKERESVGLYLETAVYHTLGPNGEHWDWYYGSPKDKFMAAAISPELYASILTPAGVDAMKAAGIPHISILIDANTETIEYRMITIGKREINEARRRIEADKGVFKDVKADIVIPSDGMTPEEVYEYAKAQISIALKTFSVPEVAFGTNAQ